jgi:hypothetical protein
LHGILAVSPSTGQVIFVGIKPLESGFTTL